MAALAVGVLALDGADGGPAPAERRRALVANAVLAERLGFDAWWLDAPAAARAPATPAVLLAAIAARTERLRLGARVRRLADLELLRVAEDYATLDGIAGGRIELAVGGADEDGGLRESVELLRRLWSETDLSWSGRVRPPLEGVTLEPRPVQRPHPPLWIAADAAGDAELAGELGLSLLLTLTGPALDLAPLAERYRERAARAGRPARVGAWQAGPSGAAAGADPAAAADAILAAREALGLELHLTGLGPDGPLLERFAQEVLPRLRAA